MLTKTLLTSAALSPTILAAFAGEPITVTKDVIKSMVLLPVTLTETSIGESTSLVTLTSVSMQTSFSERTSWYPIEGTETHEPEVTTVARTMMSIFIGGSDEEVTQTSVTTVTIPISRPVVTETRTIIDGTTTITLPPDFTLPPEATTTEATQAPQTTDASTTTVVSSEWDESSDPVSRAFVLQCAITDYRQTFVRPELRIIKNQLLQYGIPESCVQKFQQDNILDDLAVMPVEAILGMESDLKSHFGMSLEEEANRQTGYKPRNSWMRSHLSHAAQTSFRRDMNGCLEEAKQRAQDQLREQSNAGQSNAGVARSRGLIALAVPAAFAVIGIAAAQL